MERPLASWDRHHCEALSSFISILNRCICCHCCSYMHYFYWTYSLDIGLMVSTADFGGHSEQNLGGQVQSPARHSEPIFTDRPLLFLNFHLPLVACQLLQRPCACHCSPSTPIPQWSGSLCLECLFLHHYPLLYLPSSYSFVKTIPNAASSRKPSQITHLECFYSSLPVLQNNLYRMYDILLRFELNLLFPLLSLTRANFFLSDWSLCLHICKKSMDSGFNSFLRSF